MWDFRTETALKYGVNCCSVALESCLTEASGEFEARLKNLLA